MSVVNLVIACVSRQSGDSLSVVNLVIVCVSRQSGDKFVSVANLVIVCVVRQSGDSFYALKSRQSLQQVEVRCQFLHGKIVLFLHSDRFVKVCACQQYGDTTQHYSYNIMQHYSYVRCPTQAITTHNYMQIISGGTASMTRGSHPGLAKTVTNGFYCCYCARRLVTNGFYCCYCARRLVTNGFYCCYCARRLVTNGFCCCYCARRLAL